MRKIKQQSFAWILFSVLIGGSLLLSACGRSRMPEGEAPNQPKQQRFVTVQQGSLTPTVSAQAVVAQAVPFAAAAPARGPFECFVSEGQQLSAGTVMGKVGNLELLAPCDATVCHTVENGQVPKNYPVITLSYTGFALQIDAARFLRALPENAELNARFQITDGIGPADVLAVVVPSEDDGTPKTGVLQCLIRQEDEVLAGQSAAVVVRSETRKDVLTLPLSVVAGRQKVGAVSLLQDGELIETTVQLGASDGAYIEILAGVNEGDQVSEIPPNLDPRRND